MFYPGAKPVQLFELLTYLCESELVISVRDWAINSSKELSIVLLWRTIETHTF